METCKEDSVFPDQVPHLVFEKWQELKGMLLSAFSTFEEARAAQLKQIQQVLQEMLGSRHPDVLRLQQEASAAETLGRSFAIAAERELKMPKLGAEEWMVCGQVTDPNLQPIAGLRVSLVDKNDKPVSGASATESDEHGDFAVVCGKDCVAAIAGTAPEWHVKVEDEKGTMLYLSSQKFRFAAGRYEQVDIVIAKPQRSK